MNSVEAYIIPAPVKAEIDRWVQKFPPEHKRSAIVAALLLVQEANGGYLTQPALKAIAEYLEQPQISVYELATFYDMLELEPIGKHKISVCTNLSCQLMGCEKIVTHLQERLGVGLGETTADGQFTLREVECLAACGQGPVCQVDNKNYVFNLTPEKIDELLNKLSNGGRDGT